MKSGQKVWIMENGIPRPYVLSHVCVEMEMETVTG